MTDEPIPPAPWTLHGAALSFPTLSSRGLGLLSLVRYDDSPVGPYRELVVAHLTRRGPHVSTMLVTLEASRVGGREIWGYPKELADMTWTQNDERVTFRRGGQLWRARAFGPQFPVWLRAFTVQEKNGQTVRVPFAVKGRARLAQSGRKLGVLMEFELRVEPPKES